MRIPATRKPNTSTTKACFRCAGKIRDSPEVDRPIVASVKLSGLACSHPIFHEQGR